MCVRKDAEKKWKYKSEVLWGEKNKKGVICWGGTYDSERE